MFHIRSQKDFTDWILKQYEVTFFPKQFYINLNKIYKGTYRGLSKPVPMEDLWEMWEKKIEFLNRTYELNKQKGKDMNPYQRVYYDIAILLSKYDSYLKWKNNLNQSKPINKDEMLFLNDIPNTKKENKSIDINSLLDDI